MTNQPQASFWQSIKKNINKQRQKPPIQSIAHNQDLLIPLSYNQEQLWEIDELSADSVHNIANALKFDLRLDYTALNQSLAEIIHRHAILRTIFPLVNGKPVQKIIPASDFQLSTIDLTQLSELEQESKAKQLAAKERAHPFDLINEPGIRVQLIQLAEAKFILLLTFHHIIFDGVSFGLLFKELKILYEAYTHNQPSPLAELPVQYADFAYWQRQLLAASTENHLLKYWQKKFQDNPQSLQLPQDYLNNATFNYQGKSVSFMLTPTLTEKVKALSSLQGITLFTTLLTAFKILLYCYTQQTDLILVSPVAGRDKPEIKDLIGYFSNLLALRSNLNQDATFLEILAQINQTILKAKEHQDFPFKKLSELPALAGVSLSRGMFSFSNYKTQAPQLSGISPTALDIKDLSQEKSNFDLSVSMYDRGEYLTGTIKYKLALFKESTILQLINNFQSLIEKLIASPDLVLNSLPRFECKEESESITITNQAQSNTLDHKINSIIIDQDTKQTIAQIESCLAQIPAIQTVIVLPQQSLKDSFIVYVLPTDNANIDKEKIKQELSLKCSAYADNYHILILKQLPEYPNQIVAVNEMSNLPLTAKGNIDLPVIPVKYWNLAEFEMSLFHPHNLTQEMVSQIWSEVLGLESFYKGSSTFNLYDNFFELGGHSLAAIRFINRVGDTFQIKLDLNDLFNYPTIISLSARIDELKQQYQTDQKAQTSKWSHLVPIKTGGSKKPFFIIPGGGGGEQTLMFYGQLLFLLGQDQPVYGLRNHNSQQNDWASELPAYESVEQLASAYIKEIRSLQTEGSYIIVGECIGGLVAFEVAQQLLNSGCQVNLLLLDTLCPKGIKNMYSSRIASFSERKNVAHKSLGLLSREAKENYAAMVGNYEPQNYADTLTIIISENRIAKPLALNWQKLAQNGCEIHEVPGNHESYLGKFVQTTAQQLKTCLEHFQANSGKFTIAESSQFQSSMATKTESLKTSSLNNHAINQYSYINIWNSLSEAEKTAAIYEQAFLCHPDYSFVCTVFAMHKSINQEFAEAHDYFQQALEADPYNFTAYLHLANMLCEQKKYDQALDIYTKAIQLDPSRPGLYASLGRYQLKTGNLEAAERAFHQAIALDPNLIHAYNGLGNVQRKQKKRTEAIASYQRSLELDSQQAATYLALGSTYRTVNQLPEAIAALQQAITLDPHLILAHQILAEIQAEQGQFAKAIKSYRHLLALEPNNFKSLEALGSCLDNLDRFAEAIEVYSSLIKLNPHRPRLYGLLGTAQLESGDVTSAIANFQQAIKLNPNQPFKIYKRLGDALSQKALIQEAIAAYEVALKLKPHNRRVQSLLKRLNSK